MSMHNPPHPGEFIGEVYLEPLNISYRTVAAKLKVAPSTFNRLIKGQSNISSEMALRLSKTLGRTTRKLVNNAEQLQSLAGKAKNRP